MPTLTEKVLAHATRVPEGTPLAAKELLHLGNRAAVDQTLSRLARRGALLRVGRGTYVNPSRANLVVAPRQLRAWSKALQSSGVKRSWRTGLLQGAIKMSKRKARGVEVEMGSGNVYADLGFSDAEEMLIKAQLVTKIAEIIERKGLTQTKAAELLGLPQPKLSNLLRGRFRGFSERRLMDCLTKLGSDVQIVVKAAPRSRGNGRLSIVFS